MMFRYYWKRQWYRQMPYSTFRVLSISCGWHAPAYWHGLMRHWFRVNDSESS